MTQQTHIYSKISLNIIKMFKNLTEKDKFFKTHQVKSKRYTLKKTEGKE